jgi:hypothetical protein
MSESELFVCATSTGSSELARDEGILLVADSFTLASLVGLAQLKNNQIQDKNQVKTNRTCPKRL